MTRKGDERRLIRSELFDAHLHVSTDRQRHGDRRPFIQHGGSARLGVKIHEPRRQLTETQTESREEFFGGKCASAEIDPESLPFQGADALVRCLLGERISELPQSTLERGRLDLEDADQGVGAGSSDEAALGQHGQLAFRYREFDSEDVGHGDAGAGEKWRNGDANGGAARDLAQLAEHLVESSLVLVGELEDPAMEIGPAYGLAQRSGQILDPDWLEFVIAGSDDGNHWKCSHHCEEQRDYFVARAVDVARTENHPATGEATHDLFGAAFGAVIR